MARDLETLTTETQQGLLIGVLKQLTESYTNSQDQEHCYLNFGKLCQVVR